MIRLQKDYEEAAAYVGGRLLYRAETAVVLGSGLGFFADKLENVTAIPFEEIPHAPVVTSPFHRGEFLCGTLSGKPLFVLPGRVHVYEGYAPAEVAFFVRLFFLLGARNLILTNAAGGIAPRLRVGDFMCIADHLSFFCESPARGVHIPLFGKYHFDMSNAYDKDLRTLALDVMERQGLPRCEGVYAFMPGPQYETPAEIRALRALGADVVGMSTVAEAIAAAQCGMRTLGISCVTNLAAGLSPEPLSGKDVVETASRQSAAFVRLLSGILEML